MKNPTEELRLQIEQKAEALTRRYGNRKSKSQLTFELAFAAGLARAHALCDQELERRESDPDRNQKTFDHADDTAFQKGVKTIRKQIDTAMCESLSA